MIHLFKHHLKHKSCAVAISAATILTTWYVLGYLLAIVGQSYEIVNKILQYAPQLALPLQFVSPQAWPINGFEIKGFLLGFFQIFITTKIVVWSIMAFYERINRK